MITNPGGLETERKFLTTGDAWKKDVVHVIDMRAGYLNNNPEFSLSIVNDDDGCAVIIPDNRGVVCRIPVTDREDAERIIKLHADEPNCTVRIRIENDEAILFFKGSARKDDPLTKPDIPILMNRAIGEKLIDVFCPPQEQIIKKRHIVPHAGKNWEVDVFEGLNAGLIVAEIELTGPDEPFLKPGWAGEEVSLDKKYGNKSLTKHPYSTWESPPGKPAPAHKSSGPKTR
jgi:adenylate cyclase